MNLFKNISSKKLPDFGIGQVCDESAKTGVSVVVCRKGAICACDVRGGGPATRETDLLSPEKMVDRVHAIVLSGGSAFGLEAASGVARELRSQKVGFVAMGEVVPIVSAACIFDLNVGKNTFPDVEMGRLACEVALKDCSSDVAPVTGCVGAGCGACVGLRGLSIKKPMKSGVGFATLSFNKVVVSALTVVNSLGNVLDEKGNFLAGVDSDAEWKSALSVMNAKTKFAIPQNTTLSIIMTNANATKSFCKKVAMCAHDGFARAIDPVHTQNDGDAIFVASCGGVDTDVDVVSIMAAHAVQDSIRSAVLSAKSDCGLVGLAG